MKKALLCLVLAMTLLLAACTTGGGAEGGGSGSTGSAGDSGSGSGGKDSLVWALNADPQHMDPISTTDQVSKIVWWQIYDTLFDLDEDTQEISGWLAETWEYQNDGLELIIKIREGVMFHNGEEMKASDVVFSLERAFATSTTRGFMGTYNHAEEVDDYTIKIVCDAAYAPLEKVLSLINFAIVSEKAVTEAGSTDEYARHPIGSGAYEFVSRSSGDKIELAAFDGYWRGAPSIRSVTFKIHTETTTAVVALETGEIDIMSHMPVTDKNHLMGVDSVEWYETPYTGSVNIIFNNSQGRFADKRLRQAVSLAVDRESIIAGAVEGEGTPLPCIITPASFGYSDTWQIPERNIERAKELVAEAGYPDGLTVTMETYQSSTYSTVVEILQNQLAEIGITVEIKKVEKAIYLTDILDNHDFEMSTVAWGGETLDADYYYDILHSSMIADGRNYSEINNPELDRLMQAGRTSIDPVERAELYRQAGDILIEDCNFVTLFTFNNCLAANADLKGVTPSNHYVHRVFEYSWA